MVTRNERDSFDNIEVPADRLWGAQTQRSLERFYISSERMPEEIIMALAAIKRACALVNRDLGLMNKVVSITAGMALFEKRELPFTAQAV